MFYNRVNFVNFGKYLESILTSIYNTKKMHYDGSVSHGGSNEVVDVRWIFLENWSRKIEKTLIIHKTKMTQQEDINQEVPLIKKNPFA